MSEETDSSKEKYVPLFELGVYGEDPAVKILKECNVCPTSLASLVTALFETIMRTIPDKKQISFEEKFNYALRILMQERFNCDVTTKPYDPNSDE